MASQTILEVQNTLHNHIQSQLALKQAKRATQHMQDLLNGTRDLETGRVLNAPRLSTLPPRRYTPSQEEEEAVGLYDHLGLLLPEIIETMKPKPMMWTVENGAEGKATGFSCFEDALTDWKKMKAKYDQERHVAYTKQWQEVEASARQDFKHMGVTFSPSILERAHSTLRIMLNALHDIASKLSFQRVIDDYQTLGLSQQRYQMRHRILSY